MNIVFDLGAVLVQWRPQELLRQHFPQHAATPAQAQALANDFFHHADWACFDRGTLTMAQVIERHCARLNLPAPAVASLVQTIGDHLQPMTDTVALLARLHALREQNPALRLYYLSNMPEPYAAYITVAKARGWHGIQFESAPQVETELDAWMASRSG